MDTDAATKMLWDARRELNEARVRVAHLEQVVDGLTGLLNASGVDVGVGRPRQDTLPGLEGARESVANLRPRDAVLYVLRRRPGYNWTPRRVYDYLEQHGMVNTEVKSGIAAYDMALRRLADEADSGVERNEEKGTYTYRRGVTSVSAARNRVAHADGRVYELSETETGEVAAMRERVERMASQRATERARRLTPEEEHELEVRRKIELGRRQLEENHGIVTRPSSTAKKRGDDV